MSYGSWSHRCLDHCWLLWRLNWSLLWRDSWKISSSHFHYSFSELGAVLVTPSHIFCIPHSNYLKRNHIITCTVFFSHVKLKLSEWNWEWQSSLVFSLRCVLSPLPVSKYYMYVNNWTFSSIFSHQKWNISKFKSLGILFLQQIPSN